MSDAPSILLAEDDETDVLLLRRAFKDADLQNPVHVVRDGKEVMEFLLPERHTPADRLPALHGTVEDRAVEQGAVVMDVHRVRGFRGNGSRALFHHLIFESGGS